MQKLIRDWLEKFSVGSILVGFYQGNTYAVLLGMGALAATMYLTWRQK